MEISPKILKAAQDIATGSKPDPSLTLMEIEAAMALAQQLYCVGCQ